MFDNQTPDYTICRYCNHFIEEVYQEYDLVSYRHLDDGDQEYNHDAQPGKTRSMEDWKERNPDLFVKYPDGKIGPNSIYYSRRGKINNGLYGEVPS